MVIKGKDEVVNIKSKNINPNDENENFINDESNKINEDYNEQVINEYKDYNNVLNKIQNKILQYVENNSIPICEYMTKKSIHNFIHK